MNLIVTLEALCALIGAVEGLPLAIKASTALIERCQREARECSAAEIAALRADDDALRRALDAAIINSKE